jgi:hypothetical protein
VRTLQKRRLHLQSANFVPPALQHIDAATTCEPVSRDAVTVAVTVADDATYTTDTTADTDVVVVAFVRNDSVDDATGVVVVVANESTLVRRQSRQAVNNVECNSDGRREKLESIHTNATASTIATNDAMRCKRTDSSVGGGVGDTDATAAQQKRLL